jgi:hypothetical protein
MSYKAKSNGDGTYVVTENGVIVSETARAKRVSFAEITSHTLHGTVHHVSGPCIVTVTMPKLGDVEVLVTNLDV